MPTINPNYVAGENLAPAIIVTASTAADMTVVAADAGTDKPVGVVHDGSRYAPIPEVTTVLAAKTGEGVRVHGPGEPAMVTLGVYGYGGALVMATTGGLAITATAGNWYVGRTRFGGDADELVQIDVIIGQLNA